MKNIAFLILLLFLCSCSHWHNPNLKPNEDRRAAYNKDRDACIKRAKKRAHSEPGNDYIRLRSYDALHDEFKKENDAYSRCMSQKGWVSD